jgi:hypothetical protein
MLAINALNLANIIKDPTYVAPPAPRRLVVRKTKRDHKIVVEKHCCAIIYYI